MEHISITAIHNFIEINAIVVYLFVFMGVVIEGEIVVLLAGIFSYLGSINIFIALIAVMLGGITKSFIGYTIGYYLQKNHSHRLFISKTESRISYFLPRFKEKPYWSIFISRFFILGVGWLTLIFSGYKKIPLKVYIRAESYSLVLWSVGVIALGYFFGYTALSASMDVYNIILMILVFSIAFFILEKIIVFAIEIFNIRSLSENKK